MYPEGNVFPLIHWEMANDNLSILGCLPVTLPTESIPTSIFLSIHCHFISQLTNPYFSTSSYTSYTSHCFDILTTLADNHEDPRLILNKGLSIDNKTDDIWLRGKSYTYLLESVDSKEMAQNLWFSQKYSP